jgi:hypothetical protein
MDVLSSFERSVSRRVEYVDNLCSEFKLAFVSNVQDRGRVLLLFVGKTTLGPEEGFSSFSVRLQRSILSSHFLQTARVSLLKNSKKKFSRQ